MGWWTDGKRAAGRALKGSGAKIVRTTAVAGAGVAGSFIPFCGPVCGVAAAAAVDTLLGDPIERSAKRAIDRAGSEADDFVDSLRDGHKKGTPPPGMATTVSGNTLSTSLRGDADELPPDYSLPLAISAAALTTIVMSLYVLKKTGRL